MTMVENWPDLRERLIRAAEELDTLSRCSKQDESSRARLRAKRSGVLLALDYMRGYDASEATR